MRSLPVLLIAAALFAVAPGAGQEGDSCFGQDQYDFTTGKVDVWEYEAEFELTITKVGFWMNCRETVYVVTIPHHNQPDHRLAEPNVDFEAKRYAVEFVAFQESATVTIRIFDDDKVEDDEFFEAVLEGPPGRPGRRGGAHPRRPGRVPLRRPCERCIGHRRHRPGHD
jgi:hypothetical protein